MRPTIDAALIAHLRRRVIEHNEAHPDAKTKLGDLRKVYERGFRRANPGARALQKVEEHLGSLSKGLFEEDEHPRGGDGEFESTQSEEGHRARQENDAGYRAMTSQVVPDNRHEATAAVARNAISVAATGTVLGALAANKRGGYLSRRAGNVTAAVGGRFGKTGAKVGRKLGEATIDGASGAVHRLLRVKQGSRLAMGARKVGAFGLLSLAGGMAIRSQWKDSWLDPAPVGRTLDAYSYRTIEKAAASIELGQARVALTEMLAKNGPAGGSIDNLRAWLEQGGGDLSEFRAEGELAKGVPWGKATIRLLSTVAGLGGGTAGSAIGYGVARATQTEPAAGDFDDEHPRDGHGRFSVKSNTSRAHRFAQVGGLLGGAAAAFATHRAMSDYNSRTNVARNAELVARYGRYVKATENYAFGAAKTAKDSEKARVEQLLSPQSEDERFKDHRKRLAEIAKWSPSDPEPVRQKIRNAYHGELADRLAQVDGDHEIPMKGGEWKKLSELSRRKSANAEDNVAPATKAFRDALDRIHADRKNGGAKWAEMLDRMVKSGKLDPVKAESFAKVYNEGRVAQAKVKIDLAGHTKNVDAAEKAANALKKPLDRAAQAMKDATSKLDIEGALADEPTKAALTEAVRTTTDAHQTALAQWGKAADELDELKQNPIGVRDPKTKQPILPPSDSDVSQAKDDASEAAFKDARPVAEKIVKDDTAAIKDKQINRLHNALTRRQVLLAMGAHRTGVPKRARAAAAHMALLTEAAQQTERELAAAELAHLPNHLENERLKVALKPLKVRGKKGGGKTKFTTPPGMTDTEAEALRGRKALIEHNFEMTRLEQHVAEQAHITATTALGGALATYNATMQALPPSGRAWLDLFRFSPHTKTDLNRLRQEIARQAGDFVKTPSGKKLKALYDKISTDAVKHGKAVPGHIKNTAGMVLKDLFTRDDPTLENPKNWRVDYSKVLPALTIGGAALGFSQADLVTHIQRRFGSEESRDRASKKKLHIDNKRVITDPRTGRGYWTMHMDDPNNPHDKIVLVGNTFDDSRGNTRPLTSGSSLSAVKQAMAEEEERRKKNQQGSGGGAKHGHDMPKMSDDEKKLATAAVSALANNNAIAEIPTYDGGPSLHARKNEFQAKGDLDSTLGKGRDAVTSVLREKHNLKSQSPVGANYHSALAALFSGPASALTVRQKYQTLTGFSPEGHPSKMSPILKANEGYKGTAAEALRAVSSEIDRVTQHNAPKDKFEQQNLARAIGLVAHAKGLSAAETAPLYAKVLAAVGTAGPTADAAAGPAGPAGPATSTSVASPARKPREPIDIDAPTKMQHRTRWSTDIALRAAGEVSDGVADALGTDNPTMKENLPAIISGMAARLHEHGFTEREAVGTIATVMRQMAESPTYRKGAREAMLSAHSNPEDVLWNRYMKGPVIEAIERKKDLENSADHALDHLEQLVKISMGGAEDGFIEQLHPRVSAGTPAGGEFEATGGHAGLSPGQRIAGEAAEAGTLAYRKFSGGNGGGSNNTLPGEGPAQRQPEQSWANPVRFGNEFGSALGFDTGMAGTHAAFSAAVGTLLPEFKGVGLIGGALGLLAGSKASELFSEGGEAAGRGAYGLATGRRAPVYQAPESYGVGSLLANTGGSVVGGMVGTNLGRAAGAYAGEAIGGTLGSIAGPVGSVLGGAALGYAGGKVYEGIYDYFAGYDKPAVTRAMNRFGAKPAVKA